MNTLLTIFGVITLYGLNTLIMYVLAWALTEYREPLFNVKPFNCRSCLAFWFTLLGGFALALLISDALPGCIALTVLGLIASLFNYLYIKSKFDIYE